MLPLLEGSFLAAVSFFCVCVCSRSSCGGFVVLFSLVARAFGAGFGFLAAVSMCRFLMLRVWCSFCGGFFFSGLFAGFI